MFPFSTQPEVRGYRKRIGIVVPALEEAGGVKSVAQFILRAVRTRPDFEFKLISLSMSASDPSSVLLRRPSTWARGVEVRSGRFGGEEFFHVGAWMGEVEFCRLRPRAALSSLLRGCDLIQVVAGAPCWAVPVCGHGIPVALQVATLVRVERRRRMELEHGPTTAWRNWMTHASTKLDEFALRQVDAVQVENPWMFSYAQARARRPEMVRFAPPGVDTSRFTALAERHPAGGYIFTVGRFDDPRKNIGLLLEAYALVCGRMANSPRLVLAGASGPPDEFWRRAAELGLTSRIEFIQSPSTAELSALYRDAQTFVLSSDEEGFGVVIIEAMASGLPVVCTRSGGPEGFVLDGADGFLVGRDDAATLADRLVFLAQDPEANVAFGRRALAKARRQFSQAVAGQAYLDVYDQLLADRAAQDGGEVPCAA